MNEDTINNEDGIGLEEQEFFNWCDANDIDRDEMAMDEDECKSFVEIKNRFMRAIKQKRLVVDGMKLEYTISKFSPTAGEKLFISRPTGKDFFAMDGFKETQKIQQSNAFMSSICGKEKSYVAKLDFKDRGFLQDIALLFITA